MMIIIHTNVYFIIFVSAHIRKIKIAYVHVAENEH